MMKLKINRGCDKCKFCDGNYHSEEFSKAMKALDAAVGLTDNPRSTRAEAIRQTQEIARLRKSLGLKTITHPAK